VFIPPMLATRLEDPRRLADPGYYSAEPKLDGQRAQLHVRDHRSLHVFSHPGRELIWLRGLAWLQEVRWSVAAAVLDGEAVAGDGSEGIQAVFEARHRPGSPMAFAAFDVLELDGASVMGEPWTARRKRLEDLLEARPPGVCLVPVTEDAPALWDTWVGMGGEGIVLKERIALYRPGVRSPAWLKLKPKLTLAGIVTGSSAERIACGDWGESVMLAFHYTHPRTELRQRYFANGRALGGEPGQSVVDPVPGRGTDRIVGLEEMANDADAQTSHAPAQIGHGSPVPDDRCSRDRTGCVLGRPDRRPRLVKREGERQDASPADTSVGRLDAGDPTQRQGRRQSRKSRCPRAPQGQPGPVGGRQTPRGAEPTSDWAAAELLTAEILRGEAL
jgi:ATP dependent DNA ligase domain